VDGLQIVDPSNSWLKVWLSSSKNLVEIPGDEPMFYEEQQVPHGTLHIHKYQSKSLGVPRQFYLYTPPGYETNRNTKYPVLYLFHGFGDDESAWTVVGRANVIMDNLLAQKKARPLIIVMPYGHTPSAPPEMRSIGRYEAFEKDLVQDVFGFVERSYRTDTGRKNRAVAGLSMGGGQSLNIGLPNVDKFPYIGGFSSAPNTKQVNQLFTNTNIKQLLKLWMSSIIQLLQELQLQSLFSLLYSYSQELLGSLSLVFHLP